MYSTSVFYYYQRQTVVLLSGNSTGYYMPVYAKTMKLNKGVDNQIQFQFLNQSQKNVDITGKTITCRLISYDGNRVLLKKALTPIYPLTGLSSLIVLESELQDIPAQKCYYSLEIEETNFGYPVYVDPTGGARGDIDIIDSVLPRFVPSDNITIPTQLFPNTVYANGVNLCNILGNTTVTYFSSAVSTDNSPVVTIQASYTEYQGNVLIEGSTMPDAGWYPVSNTYTYANITRTEGYVIEGYHPYIRLSFSTVYGNVANILIR